MSFVHWLSVGFALALCVVPVLLLRPWGRRGLSAGQPDEPVPPTIIRNAWIAYAARVSVFVPLFAWGAAGDIWPAIVGAVGFGAGLCGVGALRRTVTALADAPRREGRPATLHAFIAEACGGAVSVRLATASATVVALLGLVGAEAAALVGVVTPLVGDSLVIPSFVALIAVAGLFAMTAGSDNVRYASQALLGAIHIGLFGSAALLLYLHASDLRPMPPHGAFALMALTACCLAVLIYRRTQYCETPALVAPQDGSRWRRTVNRQVRRLLRIANVGISVLVVFTIVMAGMEFYLLGLPDVVRSGFAALGKAPQVPAVGLAGIAALALTYPLVDAVSWQGAGALVGFARAVGVEPDTTPALFRRPMRMVAGETAMIGLLVAAFGAIAALSTDLPADSAGMPDLIRQLVLFDNEISDGALTLLLVGLFAMAASTMGMAVTTAVTVVGHDILPAPRRERGDADDAGTADHRAVIVVAALTVAIAAVWIIAGIPPAGFADARFFALAAVFACLQVSLLPLLLARLGGFALPDAGSALTVLAGGAAATVGACAIYGATADMLWLWLAVPACIVSGLLLLAVAVLRGRSITPPR